MHIVTTRAYFENQFIYIQVKYQQMPPPVQTLVRNARARLGMDIAAIF